MEVLYLDSLRSRDPIEYLKVSREIQRTLASGETQAYFSSRTLYDATVFVPNGTTGDAPAFLGKVILNPRGDTGFSPDVVLSGTVGGGSIHDLLAADLATGASAATIWKDLLSGDDYLRGNDRQVFDNTSPATIHGYDGADVLVSGTLSRELAGDNGDDVLFMAEAIGATGGRGRDTFLFDHAGGGVVRDFTARADTLAFDSDAFGGLAGGVTDANLVFGAKAADTDDRLIVNYHAGAISQLYYDDDGTGPDAQRLIGTFFGNARPRLGNFAVVQANDFLPADDQPATATGDGHPGLLHQTPLFQADHPDLGIVHHLV